MIVFILTNNITDQNYVGTTRGSAEERWEQFKQALPLGIKAPLYDDMREHGVENFSAHEFGVAMDREQSRELIDEAIAGYEAINLQGVKTTIATKPPAAPIRNATPKLKASSKTAGTATTNTTKKASIRLEKPKLSTGRSSSSSKEKRIREMIAKEKAELQAAKQAKATSESDEMAAIMARIDSRSSSSYRRR